MAGRPTRNSRARRLAALAVLAGGTLAAAGCALAHHEQAPAIRRLALEYEPPELHVTRPVDAAVKVARFSGLAPYDGTTMYFRRAGVRMGSFNYDRWVAAPADQIADLLYRDLASAHAFRAVFPRLSAERARFRLEGTVVECVSVEKDAGWQAHLTLDVTLVDTAYRRGARRLLLQREFGATRALAGGSASEYAEGMSAALKTVSEAVLRAAYDACRVRADEGGAP